MQTSLADRRVCIWDFDNVIYPDRHKDGFRVSHYFEMSFLEAAREIMPHESSFTLREKMDEGFIRYGASALGFDDLAPHHNVERDQLRSTIHSSSNAKWLALMEQHFPHRLQKCPEMIALFAALRGKISHGCISHACRENWIKPLLTKFELIEFFEPNALLGLADYEFQPKHQSTLPLSMALERLQATPGETIFLEDTLRNLAKAKELSPDILTVLVHHGRVPDQQPAYVDVMIRHPKDLLRQLVKAHCPQQRTVTRAFDLALV